jgi:hypothetical protein
MEDKDLNECFLTHEQFMGKFSSRMDEYKLDRTQETKLRALQALDEVRNSHAQISKRLSEMIAANKKVGGPNVKRKIG